MFTQLGHHLAAIVDTGSLPNSGQTDPTASAISVVLSIVFAITASIALLMIVIAGFRYTVAHGDPKAVAQARNTILYSVIGLVVSMAAYSIVVFVIGSVG